MMIDLTEITEATIIRDLQPNDLIVLSVPDALLTPGLAQGLQKAAAAELGCKVLVKPDSITLDWQRVKEDA